MEKRHSLQTATEYYMVCHWLKFCQLFPRLKKSAVPTLTLNERLTKTAAYAYTTQNRIELSAQFLRQHRDMMLDEIIPHELAHLADVYLNGASYHCHGKNWQMIMIDYGLPPNRFHTMELAK